MEIALVVVAIIVVAPLLYIIGTYNGLIKIRNHCDEAWSNIDTELKRRYDLIPNLINTVKGYATHEKELLEEVTRQRQVCMDNTGSPAQQAITESVFGKSLGRLMARVEAYPDLKASANFLELQHELTNTEDRIQAARRFYNGNIRENNNKVESFPSNIIANMFGFPEREFFELEDAAARQAPKIDMA